MNIEQFREAIVKAKKIYVRISIGYDGYSVFASVEKPELLNGVTELIGSTGDDQVPARMDSNDILWFDARRN
jgi:hypothetical protein